MIYLSFLRWLFGSKENISDETLEHSSKGSFKCSGKFKSGGHGQENLEYLEKKGIEFNIVKEYKNGVRVGNVPKHDNKKKKVGINQSWFPKNWDRDKIKKAGQVVSRGGKKTDGEIKTGHYGKVNVGIIRLNGNVATIFPMNIQKDKRGKIINERKQVKRVNQRKSTSRCSK